MSRAQDLFEAIRLGGFAHIEKMVEDGISEELFLDYKLNVTGHPSHKLDESDRRNFARAISGFGNSDGGIIVWGVDCRSVDGEGDLPNTIHLMPSAIWFKSLLDGAVSGLTLPPHSYVENIAVTKGKSLEGVVVSHIPAGMDTPFQNIVGNKYYYVRAGSSFEPAPHGVLAGMFGRRPSPLLKGKIEPLPIRAATGEQVTLKISVALKNEGRGVADDPHFTIEAELPPAGSIIVSSITDGQWDIRRQSSRNRFTFISTPNFPRLIPDETVSGAVLAIRIPRHPKGGLVVVGTCGSRDSAGAPFEYRLSANQTERIAELTLGKHLNDDDRERCLEEANLISLHKWNS